MDGRSLPVPVDQEWRRWGQEETGQDGRENMKMRKENALGMVARDDQEKTMVEGSEQKKRESMKGEKKCQM